VRARTDVHPSEGFRYSADDFKTVTLSTPRQVCGGMRFTRLRMLGRTFSLNTVTCSTYYD